MLDEVQIRSAHHRRDVALAILLIAVAFGIRISSLGFNSLSEDETAKWSAVQQYRQGHFAGVNSEHPMVMKMLAWGSVEIGERWNRMAAQHGLPVPAPEAWLRLPNAILGAATAAILYLLCRLAMGAVGSFAAGFFWAVSPLSVALNRLLKEETALTCFTLLGCYFYWRCKNAKSDSSTRRWLDLSACAFGLATASQYIIHLFGLNQLAWLIAGRRGLDNKPLGSLTWRMLGIMALVFFMANPLILSPASVTSILHWLHHGTIQHTGYAFNGHLYLNFPSLLLAGVPWYFYLWMLLVKTPIPILVAMIAGGIFLLCKRTVASCLFLSLGLVQLIGLSLSGAKWLRYSLPLLPFLYLAAGYAVQVAWTWAAKKRVPATVAWASAVLLLGWPLLEALSWSPYYPLYLNPVGGGRSNIARYFGPDEISEFDTREVAQQICSSAPGDARVATGRPDTMTYYVQSCGRPDIKVVPLYDSLYIPKQGDTIVLERSRRFVETQSYFDQLANSDLPHCEVQVGPVSASTIYLFQPSALAGTQSQSPAFTQARYPGCHATVDDNQHQRGAIAHAISMWLPPLRQTR